MADDQPTIARDMLTLKALAASEAVPFVCSVHFTWHWHAACFAKSAASSRLVGRGVNMLLLHTLPEYVRSHACDACGARLIDPPKRS